MKELDEFLESDFGIKCAEWLVQDLKDNGPLLLSTLGQGRFLPEAVSVTVWLSKIPGVEVHVLGAGRDFCVSAECPGDVRVKRTKPSVIPQWILAHQRDAYSSPIVQTVKEQQRTPQGGWLARVVSFLRRFFLGWIGGRGRHVPHKVWNRYLEQLKHDNSLTVWIRYRDERPSFTASAFLGGDEESIMVRSQGRIFQIEREDVAELQLISTEDPKRNGTIGTLRCEIRAWYSDKGEFGFAYGIDSRETYYFDRSGIGDFQLLQSLRRGELGQMVECRMSNRMTGKKYARVEIIRMCDTGTRKSGKDRARTAMLRGDLKLAEGLYLEVLANSNNPEFIPALKDLAELYNRTDSRKALDLLAKYEPMISNESQEDKISFDNMRFIFCCRANMHAEARDVAVRVLRTCENRNYAAYVRDYDAGRFSGIVNEKFSAICTEENFVPIETPYGKHLIQSVGSPDGLDFSNASVKELVARFKDVGSRIAEAYNSAGPSRLQFHDVAYASNLAGMDLQLCAIVYWEKQKDVEGKVVRRLRLEQVRKGWRNYFYRQLQCRLFSQEDCSLDCKIASLVWTGRCSNRIETDRYQIRLPIVLTQLVLGHSESELQLTLDANDFDVGAVISHIHDEFEHKPESRQKIEHLAIAYGLRGTFVSFDCVCPLNAGRMTFDYDSLIRRVCEFVDSDSMEVAVSMVDTAADIVHSTMQHVEDDGELKGQMDIILDIARKYASAVSFVEKRNECQKLERIWEDFEGRYIDCEPTLYTTDVYYPVLNALQDEIQADFAKSSMGQVSLSLVHQSGHEYEVCDGKITLKLKLVSEHESAPAITSFSAYVVNDESWNVEEPDAICSDKEVLGGQGYPFELTLAVDVSAIEKGAGDVDVLLRYTTDGGGSAEERFVISYTVPKEPYLKLDNPYASLVGAQATGEYLVGREDVLRQIRESFDGKQGGQCFVLWGQRRSGKTSILTSVNAELKRADDKASNWYIYTWLDAGSWGDYDCGCVRKFVNGIVSDITRSDNVGEIPELARVPVESDLEKLACIAAHLQGLGMTWVVGVDEVTTPYNNWIERSDERYKYAAIDFMRFLKSCLSKKLFHLVLIGQDTMPNFRELCGNEFAVTNIVPVSYLKSDDVRKLIDLGFVDGKGKSHITDAAFMRLDSLTNGAPFFIHPLCSLLVRLLNDQHRPIADVAQVNAVLNEKLSGETKWGWCDFEQWTNLKVPDLTQGMVRDYYHRIARRTVDGIWATKDELVESQTDARMFDILVERKILRSENGRYRLWVNLFTEWLLANEEEAGN